MKQLTILILFCLTGLNSFSEGENIIKLKSEVTLTLSKIENGGFTYKIADTKTFDETVDFAVALT